MESLPLGFVDLTRASREDVLAYFRNTWALTEALFSGLRDDSVFYMMPDRLRRPLIFYWGAPLGVACFAPRRVAEVCRRCIVQRARRRCAGGGMTGRRAARDGVGGIAGHPAAAYANKLHQAGLIDNVHVGLQSLLQTGVDEMSWDDMDAMQSEDFPW